MGDVLDNWTFCSGIATVSTICDGQLRLISGECLQLEGWVGAITNRELDTIIRKSKISNSQRSRIVTDLGGKSTQQG